jgi:DNA-binding PadR family transcriptional regulator
MDDPRRITPSFLAVVEALWESEEGLYGYEIKTRLKLSGPTVYNNLDRLRKLGWVTEVRQDAPRRPTRFILALTAEGRVAARDLLIARGRITETVLGRRAVSVSTHGRPPSPGHEPSWQAR